MNWCRRVYRQVTARRPRRAEVEAWIGGPSLLADAAAVAGGRPERITVNSIPPGRIMSEQIERNYTPEYRQWQSANEIPVGEYGRGEAIANLVCFLVSPLARYITGTVIPVDGGLRRYQF